MDHLVGFEAQPQVQATLSSVVTHFFLIVDGVLHGFPAPHTKELY
jgi:hypothetical protein